MTAIQIVGALHPTPGACAQPLPAAALPARRRPSVEVASWRNRPTSTTPGTALALGAMADGRSRLATSSNVHVRRGFAAATGAASYGAKHVQGSPPRGRPV